MIPNLRTRLREHWEASFAYIRERLGAFRFESVGIIQDAVGRVQSWWEQPTFRDFVFGLPALAGLAVVVIVSSVSALESPIELISRYKNTATTSMLADQLAVLQVASERLALLDPTIPEGQFGLGIAAERSGDFERALALILPLAPRDQPGYPTAHVWCARHLLAAHSPGRAALQEAEGHLVRAMSSPSEEHEARGLLAKVYLDTDRVEQAAPLVVMYATAWPDLTLRMARIHLARDERRLATGLLDRLAWALQVQVEQSPADTASRLHLAETLGLQGKFFQAAHVLQNGMAVDSDGPYGIPLATIYLQWADSLAATPADSTERTKLIRGSIALFEKYAPNQPETLARLYRLHQSIGNTPEAERYLIQAAREIPTLRVELARLYQQRGVAGKAVELARHALEDFREQLGADPNNDLARLLAADAALVLGDHPRAIRLLEEGRRRKEVSPLYGPALAKIYIAWWDAESRQASQSADDRVGLLRRALRHDPWNREVICQLLLASRSPDLAAPTESMLQDMIARGDVPALAHLLLGTCYLEQNKVAPARKHLEMAYELEPRLVEAANHLAGALVRADPPDLNAALQLMNGAIAIQPNIPSLRETRGRILVQAKRWNEAVVDLERCLPAFQETADFHRALAEAYEGLGQVELANQHRRLSDQGGAPR